jgi:hypothetical protein
MPILGYWIPLTNVIQIGGRVGKKNLEHPWPIPKSSNPKANQMHPASL